MSRFETVRWAISAKEAGKGADGSLQHIPVVNAKGGTVIAHVYTNCGVTEEECRAHAHLIASAPALLDFAEFVLRDLESGYMRTKPVYRSSKSASDRAATGLAAVARDLITQAKGGHV